MVSSNPINLVWSSILMIVVEEDYLQDDSIVIVLGHFKRFFYLYRPIELPKVMDPFGEIGDNCQSETVIHCNYGPLYCSL